MRTPAALASAAAVLALAAGTAAAPRAPAQTICGGEIKATVEQGIIRYCGPATAHVSRFPRVTFRGGSCTWSRRPSGFGRLTVYIGSRTLNQRTNGGHSFFSVSAVGIPPRLTGGAEVTLYAKGKRWLGEAPTLRFDGATGHFVAKGFPGSSGRAIGTFRC